MNNIVGVKGGGFLFGLC